MKKILYSLLVVSVVIGYACCCKSKCVRFYVFEIPLEITPSEPVLSIGDTLRVTMRTENQEIYDTVDNRIVYFPNFNPYGIFRLARIDTFPFQHGFYTNELRIDTSEQKYDLVNTKLGLSILYTDIVTSKTESYMSFEVVLNTPGTYILVLSDNLWVIDGYDRVLFNDRCTPFSDLDVIYSVAQGYHEEILAVADKENVDIYFENSKGERALSELYYFRVE